MPQPFFNTEGQVMIIIRRNDKTIVITGWRAWLIGVAIYTVIAVAVVVVGFLLLGIAITIATLLFFAIPLAIALGLIASWVRSAAVR
jgi:hypothetical protein